MQTEHDKALDRAKIALLLRPDSVFITTILFSLKLSWDDAVGTACTNGKYLKISPQFFMDLSLPERMFLLAHEAYHVAFQHMVRVGKRDMRKWNIATDYVINLILRDIGMVMPTGGLYDEAYRDHSSYEVYELLDDDDLPDAPDHMDIPDDEDIEQISQDIQSTVVKANIQAREAGQGHTVPAEISTELDKLLNPLLPWHKILKKQLGYFAREDYTTAKFNKRYFPNMYLPTLHSPKVGEITVAIDVSGSINETEFRHFLSEVYAIHHKLKPEKTTVLSWDTSITSNQQMKSKKDIEKMVFTGGGGTEISDVYDWVNKHKPRALIVFTDGYFQSDLPNFPINTPIYWVLHEKYDGFVPPKGKVMHFELPK